MTGPTTARSRVSRSLAPGAPRRQGRRRGGTVPLATLVIALFAVLFASVTPAAATGGAPARRERPAAAGELHAVATGLRACDSSRRPVVMVHGFTGDRGVWSTMTQKFEEDGYCKVYYYDYPSGPGPFVHTLEELASGFGWAVREALGGRSVDVVAHSMGSLITRQAIRYDFNGSGEHVPALGSQVAHWVSLAGPNHGAKNEWLNALCGTMTCGPQLTGMKRNSAFLAKLNSGTEAPGPTQYLTYRTPGDEQVDEDSVPLTGNAENRRIDLRHARGPSTIHNRFMGNSEVISGVLAFFKHGPTSDIEQYKPYRIAAEHSGKMMDVRDAAGARGTPVQQYQANGTNAQVWEFFQGYAPGVYNIRSGVDFCLKEQDAQAVLGDCSGGHTYWQAVPAGDGSFYLRNDFSGTYLDVPGHSHANSVQLITYRFTGGTNQRWRLSPA
ncbi:alpha/beta fold hydrolase [Streptomyces sp. NPDC048664]|uniref:alpha/beta fold hydrolase n=1 Tax=Streptomyces sp. NPDC048664 TaxID=3154505 RepID=UPI00341C863A